MKMMPKTDCRNCLFYNGEFCKLPFFSNHKTNLWDYCISFDSKGERHPETRMAKKTDEKFHQTKEPRDLQIEISDQD